MLNSIEKLTIGNLFEKNVRAFPNKTVQVVEGKRQTFKELNERANRLANGLLDLNLKKGSHVAILATNCMEYMEFALATAKIGVVSVLINYLLPKERIAYMLDHSDSQAVVFESQFLDVIAYTKTKTASVDYYIMLEGEENQSNEGTIGYEALLSQSSNTKPDVEVKITDANSLIYTTGTTGTPKGVLKSMAADMSLSILSSIYFPHYNATHVLGLPPYSHRVNLAMSPQFHVGGYGFTLNALIFPNTVVFTKKFEPENFLRIIHKEKVNSTWVQPAMLYQIKKLPEEIINKYDVSSITTIICGSTSLTTQESEDMLSVFPNAKLGSNYAATEIGLVAYVSGEELQKKSSSCIGRTIFSADMKVADENGKELGVGEIGLLWSTSPGMPINCEYYKDEENTKENFKDGWVAVGDLGWKDEEGYFYYYGRTDDIINSGGEKVSPLPVEEVIQQYPGVNSVAVIGILDERWQEAVTAVVVPKKDANLSEEDIILTCEEKLANYEVPKKIYLIDELPLGPTGKVDRRGLKKMIHDKINVGSM